MSEERGIRQVRRLTPEDMDDFMTVYLHAYPINKDASQACREKYTKKNLEVMEHFHDVNIFGLFEDGQLIATAKLIDFSMNLFGEMKPATGLMALGVHPLHKKKGAARDFVRYFEDYTKESGGLVSLLLPFRMDFYRKLGYGCGTKLDEYHIPTLQLPAADTTEGLRMLSGGIDVEKVLACYDSFAEKNHGALRKFSEEVRDISEDDETYRIGYFDGEELKGYATYRMVPASDVNYTLNRMDVSELIYHSPKALRQLLGGLRMQADLAQTAVIRTGEMDFYHLLDSPQDVSGNYIDFGFLQTNVSAVGTMYKIPDLPKFVEETAHRRFPAGKPLTVEFDVYDELAARPAKHIISFTSDDAAGCRRWRMAEGDAAPGSAADVTVKCRLSDLSSLLMGSADLSALVRLGVMEVSGEAYAEELDELLHVKQRPFTNTDY